MAASSALRSVPFVVAVRSRTAEPMIGGAPAIRPLTSPIPPAVIASSARALTGPTVGQGA
jgi:hypothetical protein